MLNYFEDNLKAEEEWKIGTEYECIGVYRENAKAVDYSGDRGIETILKKLSLLYNWDPVINSNHVIGLRGPDAGISLEPGGQIELSGKPHRNVHTAQEEYNEFINKLLTSAEGLNISFLGLGMQPVSTLDEIQWVPKERYRIMAPYMEKVGTLGHRMMKQTASVQVNIDYSSETDAMNKFRTAMGLVPLLSAIFANSPISDNKLNGYMTFRGHVWANTDSQRCGLLKFAFNENVRFEDYIRYALNVPMYFISRDERLLDMTGLTFKEFMETGCEGHYATVDDWGLHLSTLFPEVRMKKYIEIRCFDNIPQQLVMAVPAIIKGIFYDNDCLLAARDLVRDMSWEERLDAYHSAHLIALDTKIRGVTFTELAKELMLIAINGLSKQNTLNNQGENETVYMDSLQDMIWSGRCPADFVRESWLDNRTGDLIKFIDSYSYKA